MSGHARDVGGIVLSLCTPSPAGSLLWWLFPARAVETGRCSQSCYPSTLEVGLLALQAGLGCMEE